MRGLRKQFKAPRQVRKEKGTARQSESDDDDDIPFSQLREKVIAETQGSPTEKDRPRQVKEKMFRLLNEKEADEIAMFGEVITWSDDENATEVTLSQLAESLKRPTSETLQTEEDPIENVEAVGTKVAKDFGSLGVFIGKVLSVEYDSDDDIKAKPYYCVEYSDGDREDLNEEEFVYAKELCFQMELDAEDEIDDMSVTSDNDEDNSKLPSTKVTKLPSELFSSHRQALTPLYIPLPLFRKNVSVARRKKTNMKRRDLTMTRTSRIVLLLR